jgi:subtilisin family serine protease
MSRCDSNPGEGRRRQLISLLERREDIAVFPPDALDKPNPPLDFYAYRPGEVLVPSDPEQLRLFEEAARAIGLDFCTCEQDARPKPNPAPDAVDSFAPGSEFPPPANEAATRFSIRSRSDLDTVLTKLERAADGRLRVSPNHVLFVVPFWDMGAYGDPVPTDLQLQIPAGSKGEGVTVAVVDGGLPEGFQANDLLAAVVAEPQEPWRYDGSHLMTEPEGHGSFVAGVVRQVAPGAQVTLHAAVDTDGVTDEYRVAGAVALALEEGPDIINLSLGGTTRHDRSLLALGALGAASQGPNGPIVVAAAGNGASPRRFYPAAETWALGVGAARIDGPVPVRAGFSDYGAWVRYCANGVGIVSSFEHNSFSPDSDPADVLHFNGFAVWQGTSFAAPQIAGVLAGLLSEGLDRDDAVTALDGLGPDVEHIGKFVPSTVAALP